MKKQKGASLLIVFIICTVIGILLTSTFFVTSNYGFSIVSRKKELRERVCPTCVVETSQEDDSGDSE